MSLTGKVQHPAYRTWVGRYIFLSPSQMPGSIQSIRYHTFPQVMCLSTASNQWLLMSIITMKLTFINWTIIIPVSYVEQLEQLSKQAMNDASPNVPQMDPFEIMEEGIRKLLSGLNPNKAAGPDKLQPQVLKELADVLAPMVTLIYNASKKQQKVPRDWKTANVAPIFKKGEKYKASNYRPVSLTCVLCKCMEHIVASQVMQHLTKNNILYNHQHGFRSKLSTET